MARFAANLTLLFNEWPVLERFRAARDAGFRYVEMLFPFHYDVDAIQRELEACEQELVLFDTDPGDFAAGDRGYLCHPGQEERFLASVRDAVRLAQRLGTRRLNALAGLVPAGVSFEQARSTVVGNLRRAAPIVEDAGLVLLIEALNTYETPGYFLSSSRLGFEIVAEVDRPAVQFQYDAYHLQIMEGNLISTIRANVARIGHVQIADVPGRHQPGTGEVNYRNVLAALDAAGYAGFVGLEYRPDPSTLESFGWMREL